MTTYNLDYVVRSTLVDIDASVASPLYIKGLKWANSCYRELSSRVAPRLRCERLPIITDGRTRYALLPEDYVTYTRIAVCVCVGNSEYLINLSMNDNICTCHDPTEITVCDCSTEETCEQITGIANQAATGVWNGGTWYYPYLSRYMNGQFVAGFYAYGANVYRGGYKVVPEMGKIFFDAYMPYEHFVLEYQSNGAAQDGNPIIDWADINTYEAYVHWQRCKFTNGLKNEAQAHYRTYLNGANGIKRRLNAQTQSEWYQMFREQNTQRPKR